MPSLLIIEDDPALGPRLQRNLELSGFDVILAQDGRSGLDTALNTGADLILLDLMLPLVDGMSVLKRLRRGDSSTPVIILTAKGEEGDRLEGFRLGCDDYVTKPFSLMELIARIRVALRRSGFQSERRPVSGGGVEIDPSSRTVRAESIELSLTPREFDLLYALASRPGKVMSRKYLLHEVWGEESGVTARTVDSHVASLRRKLGEAPGVAGDIVTIYKVGYKWAPESENLRGDAKKCGDLLDKGLR